MEQNFQRSLAWVLEEEGGWSDHPEDNGGATMKGITISVYSNWLGREATKTELRNIPDSTIAAIYKKNYWDKVWGDRLPAGVDYAVFDFAVNSGPGRSVRFLQGVVGATQDGAIGPQTLRAVENYNDIDTIRKLCAERLKWLKGLADWQHFGRGWEARINRVQPRALALVTNDVEEDEETPYELPLVVDNKDYTVLWVAAGLGIAFLIGKFWKVAKAIAKGVWTALKFIWKILTFPFRRKE